MWRRTNAFCRRIARLDARWCVRGRGQDPDIKYIAVTNEAEGASVAAGARITGGRPVLVMENSGLRAACEALARLGLVNGIPVNMLMGYRGDLGERFHWDVNHGMTMEPLPRWGFGVRKHGGTCSNTENESRKSPITELK